MYVKFIPMAAVAFFVSQPLLTNCITSNGPFDEAQPESIPIPPSSVDDRGD
jgi:hypothetical protein